MTVCNLSRASVSVIVSVMFLLAACTVGNEETTPPAIDATQPAETRLSSTTETFSTPTGTVTPIPADVVEVTVDKAVYQVGKRVRFTISNHSDRSVYYRIGGCFWPFIVRLEGGNEVQLVTNILDVEIPTRQLAAGETLSCKWNQIAWWNTDETGIMRFRTMNGSHQVPPGQYQVKFPYAFEEEHIHSRVLSITAESQVFIIE